MNTTTTTQMKATRCIVCGAFAEVYITGEFAGTWRCTNPDCFASEVCAHDNTHPETISIDCMRNGEYDDYEATVEVCDLCEQTVESR